MIKITTQLSPDEFTEHESSYTTQYATWNGLVTRNAVLRQIIDIRAASVFSSWTVKGSHKSAATKLLEEMKGRNGRESFKQILANMYRIAYIAGDAYAEKIYEDNDMDKPIIDLHILPSDNIRQVIKRGEIIRYEEIQGNAKWEGREKSRIFHIRYNPRGAMTHGIGMVEALNNILVSREQLMQVGQDIYERMSQPKQIILAKTSGKDGLNTIRDALKAAGDTWNGIAVLPESLIGDTKEITLNPSLKPQEYLDYLDRQIFSATCTPEIMLGVGYANSDESLVAHLAGFYGSVRYDQEMFEDDIYIQIFSEMWPASPPTIEFSFSNEAEDDKFNRELQAMPMIDASPTIAPQNKELIVTEILERTGFIT